MRFGMFSKKVVKFFFMSLLPLNSEFFCLKKFLPFHQPPLGRLSTLPGLNLSFLLPLFKGKANAQIRPGKNSTVYHFVPFPPPGHLDVRFVDDFLYLQKHGQIPNQRTLKTSPAKFVVHHCLSGAEHCSSVRICCHLEGWFHRRKGIRSRKQRYIK